MSQSFDNFKEVELDNFRESYKKTFSSNSKIYDIDGSKLEDVLEELRWHQDNDNFTQLFHFIKESELFELYINDMIAPLVPRQFVLNDLQGQLLGSVGFFRHILYETNENQNTIMILPMPVCCSIIQNAYLLITSVDDVEKFLMIAAEYEMDIDFIHKQLLHILFFPLNESLLYRVLNPNKLIPHYFIMTFGVISAVYATKHSEELIEKFEDSIDHIAQEIKGHHQNYGIN